MGDARSQTTAPTVKREELHVLVTGFAPWAANNVNPSFLVARALSERLDLHDGTIVHIHTVTEPVKVTYKFVRNQIPSLLFPQVSGNPPPIFDLVVFIGMAGGSNHYTVETLARRDGYLSRDGDKELLEGAERDLWKQLYNAPEVLRPAFDTDDVWRRWKNQVPDQDVRPSSDAGLFLCEFIYYTGLVEYWRRGRGDKTPVVFMHVPGQHDAEAVLQGKQNAEALIKALIVSGRIKGIIGSGNRA